MSRKIEIENRIHNLKTQVIDLKYRATGRTTRLVDEYIQKICENKGNHHKDFKLLFGCVIREHLYKGSYEIKSGNHIKIPHMIFAGNEIVKEGFP